MILSADQLSAIQRGSPVPINLDGTDCVVLRKDLYDKVKGLIYDDSEVDPREMYPAVLSAWDQDDNPDDYESYQ
jgi:hypothetical protein